MQICTSPQTDNHTSTPPLSFLQAGCPSCRPTNSIKNTEGTHTHTHAQLFYGSMDFVRDNLCEPVPEETFTHIAYILICLFHVAVAAVAAEANVAISCSATFPSTACRFEVIVCCRVMNEKLQEQEAFLFGYSAAETDFCLIFNSQYCLYSGKFL